MKHFASIVWAEHPLAIEYAWLGHAGAQAPLVVFLHEGLGSLAMWRDFPEALCHAAGVEGLVYSRPGYGFSSPYPSGILWGADFMHRQAWEVLPLLLEELAVDTSARPLLLFGHSDGATIALLYAARFSGHLRGVILLAPHICVEERSIEGIQKARHAFVHKGLRERLGRYHADPDAVFWAWNRAWLNPAFRNWSIENELAAIRCRLLAVQGLDDAYGTLEQIRGIARRVAGTRLLELEDCGHQPQREQRERLITASVEFIRDCVGSGAIA